MESTLLNSGSISVPVQIISRVPAIPSLFRKRRRSFKYDEDATVFVRKTDGFADGSLCRLSVGNRSIHVIMRIIDDENCNSMEVDASMSTVYLSPCLAATLGLHWFHLRYKKSTMATLDILDYSSVVEASRATVKEIGLLPPIPRFRSTFGTNHRDDQQQFDMSEDDSGLRQFFMHQKQQTDEKSKPRQRLLSLGSIFATNCEDGNSDHVRFYKVVDIQSPIQQENEKSNPNGAYFVSPSTHLTLEPQSLDDNDGFVCRLPRPQMAAVYLSSLQDAKNFVSKSSPEMVLFDSENVGTSSHETAQSIHHPSANQLADALYLIRASSTPTKACSICRKSRNDLLPMHYPRPIHIIGDEENHVSACTAEAADIMGMRYFRVEGLANFWAHYNFLQSYSQLSDEKVNRALTGQLADKLQGLAAAMKIAQKSAPCVLHVVGIDEELSPASGHSADADGRKEEEQRILQVIHEALLESSNRRRTTTSSLLGGSNETSLNDNHNTSLVTRVAVVFSSAKPLPSGPFVSSLEQNSIQLSAPDLRYARYLWNDNADNTFDEISSMLAGLSARDIVFLRQKFVPRWKTETQNGQADNEQSTGLAVSILKPLLSVLETTNALTQTSSYASGSSTVPLSSTALPNVRWEDIGGLSSVRHEIMDAVELPLKYPELFKGSRRSGILLFGPPGTGKTLVAKAVARECGLPFLSIKGPELLGSYVGESEANIRAVFEAARSAAMSAAKPHTLDSGFESGQGYGGASVLFFDELDSLAPRRGETGHGDGVMERVVATLLGELDNGLGGGGDTANSSKSSSPAPHVIVIGATNRPDLLDPSLLRPGRFDRLLYLGPAKTKEACLQILLAQTRKFKFQDGFDRSEVLSEAMQSFPPTLSGADLSAVASGALMRALKRVCDDVEEEARRINSIDRVDDKSIDAVDVSDVMESWTDEQLQPTVLVEDFVDAAKDIVPSISEDDLKRFELLRNQFSVA